MGHNQPEISVIMPAFNVETYIEAAIESVQKQTFADWELIIVDDGSTDRTAEIAESLARRDSRIRFLKMEKPSGSAYQPRKMAITHARAKIVSPLDADDRIAPTCLKGMMRMKHETGASCVYPTMYLSDSDDVAPFIPSTPEMPGTVLSGKDAIGFTLDGWRINCNGGLIDRSLYMKIYENFDSTISHACADEYLTRQLLYYADKVAISPEKYYYRINEDSITRHKSLKLFSFLINNRMLHSFISERYDRDSDTYLRLQRQLFHGIIDALRLKNKYDFDNKSYRKEVEPLISAIIGMIDWDLIRRHETRKYFYLLKFLQNHTDIAGTILKIGDKIKNVL